VYGLHRSGDALDKGRMSESEDEATVVLLHGSFGMHGIDEGVDVAGDSNE
jgi:hypothetical protein